MLKETRKTELVVCLQTQSSMHLHNSQFIELVSIGFDFFRSGPIATQPWLETPTVLPTRVS